MLRDNTIKYNLTSHHTTTNVLYCFISNGEIKYIGKTNAQITGDLTIKGITHALTFPADVTPGKNNVHAKATIKVDRTKYDIKYGSGSFFDNLGDKAIENEFTLTVNLHAGM